MDHRCAIRKAEETAVDKQPSGREDYVRKVLEAYRNTPGTCGNLRRPDRMLTLQLYQRGVPLSKIENALVLAAVRRLIRPADAPPLTTVRSLATSCRSSRKYSKQKLENSTSNTHGKNSRGSVHPDAACRAHDATTPSAWDDTEKPNPAAPAVRDDEIGRAHV